MDPISAILSFVSGAGASIFTRIMGYFTRKKELEHELVIMDKKKAQDAQDHQQEIERMKLSFEQTKELNLQKHEFAIDETELKNLQKTRDNQDKPLSVNASFIDKMNKAFRPISSYQFLFLFMFYKFAYLFTGLYEHFANPKRTIEGLYLIYDKVWDERTQCGFWAIMGFWFTNRVFDRAESMIQKTKVRY